MTNRVLYSTLTLAQTELNADNTDADVDLLVYVEQVSIRIDQLMSTMPLPYFAPYIDGRRMPLDRRRFVAGGRVFDMLFPMQALTEVLLEAVDYTTDTELDFENIGYLRWIPEALGFSALLNANTSAMRLNITGTWGFSRDYANAWQDSGDAVVDAPLSDSATSIEVGDSTLFAVGQLIQMESEWALITDIPTVDTTHLTVKRGVHGTTAASHVATTQIDIFLVDDLVQRLCARQAALWYARQGGFNYQTFDGAGIVSYPPDLLTELTNTLREIVNVQ